MPERRRKFTPDFRDEAVKMVIETSRPIAAQTAGRPPAGGSSRTGVPYRFRIPDPLGSEPEWRIVNAGATQEVR